MAKVNALLEERAVSKAGATTTASTTARTTVEAKAPLSRPEKFAATIKLQEDWRKAEAHEKEMGRQMGLMETGLKRFDADPVGSVEAIRVTFEKIIDPNSVVREGEYTRQGYGLSAMKRLEGFYQQMVEGGGNIPKPILEGMVETARQFMQGMETYNALERDRIGALAKDNDINPDLVFGVKKTTAVGEKKATAPTGAIIKDGKLYIDGKLVGTP